MEKYRETLKRYVEKANILIEALPYINKFHGSIFVIKFGGNAMVDEELKNAFAQDIALLHFVGIRPVIVHGGGPQIGKVLKQMNIPVQFVDGLRVTDEATMDVVEMVLVGQVNKSIVNLINQHGVAAVGLSGKDGRTIEAEKLLYEKSYPDENKPPEIIDIGKVGRVKMINPKAIYHLQEGGFIPIIAPVGMGEKGETYNINADTVAGEIARSLNAEKLILLTDVEGVIIDQELIQHLNKKDITELIDKGKISGGMIPKVQCALTALENKVKKAHIIDGRVAHAVLLEIFTDKGVGTEIVLD
jgi:acetylglutamate kinase